MKDFSDHNKFCVSIKIENSNFNLGFNENNIKLIKKILNRDNYHINDNYYLNFHLDKKNYYTIKMVI